MNQLLLFFSFCLLVLMYSCSKNTTEFVDSEDDFLLGEWKAEVEVFDSSKFSSLDRIDSLVFLPEGEGQIYLNDYFEPIPMEYLYFEDLSFLSYYILLSGDRLAPIYYRAPEQNCTVHRYDEFSDSLRLDFFHYYNFAQYPDSIIRSYSYHLKAK